MSLAPGALARLCRAPCWQSEAAGLPPSPKGPSEAVGLAVGMGRVTPARTRGKRVRRRRAVSREEEQG